jgi:signal transduction histidine kinase
VLYPNRSADLSLTPKLNDSDRVGGAGATSRKTKRNGENTPGAKAMRRDDSMLGRADRKAARESVHAERLLRYADQADQGGQTKQDDQGGELPRVVAVFRPFSLVSFLAIAATAIVLAMCYRYVSIRSITQQAEASNAVVAQAAVGAVEEDLGSYLSLLPNPATTASEPFPTTLYSSLYDLIKDTKVRKVNIYDRRGVVVFSTMPAEIGRQRLGNFRVVAALAGETGAKLVYRDRFNSFNGTTAEDNLIQTYLPLQQLHAGPYVGVFEIQTDMSAMAVSNEFAQIVILSTLTGIMILLYFSLVGFVRRIERVIVAQAKALRERSELLAELSARMLDAQEAEKQRIAGELHERVAQTLAAVKLTVENAVHAINRGDETSLTQLEGMIPVLQTATQDVRSVAVGLRPPSLDELGLMATLRGLCRQFAEKNPNITLESRLDLDEAKVPLALKAIIYRVAEDTCAALSGNSEVGRIALSLDADAERVVLTVRDDAFSDETVNKNHPYAAVRERTLLSGGKFMTLGNGWGGVNMMATWQR